jgi:tRNA pseudouridine38-40 synthase
MHSRYFIEVAYKGTAYAGFQRQENANTIQAEVERALKIYFREAFELTGSSRTDAGVHAFQNFFHLDLTAADPEKIAASVYHLNAILPADIVIRSIQLKAADAHCRFDALYRSYAYTLYAEKNPFLADRAFFYPYPLDQEVMQTAADMVMRHNDFAAFSKKNTQAQTTICDIMKSRWTAENGCLVYHVKGNRFLRGMVRGLVGTMLRVGRGKISLEAFEQIIINGDMQQVDFSTPAHGLTLMEVGF